ncbi:hypothetical protein [Brachybacterium sp. UNK5269]|uniref:hypothetical protein n=1 Tax=Brachybacterium sp. UNK5269 TaxID=3408576 RepID=UPI003BB0F2AE
MAFCGMDPEQVRGEADALERAARRLEEMLAGLDASVAGAPWSGPDADAFREHWVMTRRRGEAVVLPGLDERARALGQHAAEQERASADVDGGVERWILDGLDGLGDRTGDGHDLISTAVAAIGDLEWPRLTELLVDGAAGLLRGSGDVLEAVTGLDLHLADDGHGYADAPVAVSPEESGFVPPGDLSQIIANTNRTYGSEETGEVSMTVVGSPPTGVIVNIPGTEHWWPDAGDNPLDLTGNAAQAGAAGWSAGAEATADAIAQLFAQQDLPPDTPLLLNGHSQGGMIATSLAAHEDLSFRISHVMTVGAPVDNYEVPAGISRLQIQHRADPVPMIDAGGLFSPGGPARSGSLTTITLDSPGAHLLDIATNHSGAEYQDSVQAQLQDPGSQLSQYSADPALQAFLTGDPDAVQHFLAGIHRRR